LGQGVQGPLSLVEGRSCRTAQRSGRYWSMAERQPRGVLGCWGLALLLAGAVLVGACGGSGDSYVKNSAIHTYFQVPSSWKLFRQEDILAADPTLSPQQRSRSRQASWLVAFDSHQRPSLANVLDHEATTPTGFARVRVLGDDEHETFSLASLHDEVINLNELSQSEGMLDVISTKEIVRPGGIHGERLIVNVRGESGKFFTLDQTALIDKRTRLVYVLAVSCDAECYVKNQYKINTVVDSWTVKER